MKKQKMRGGWEPDFSELVRPAFCIVADWTPAAASCGAAKFQPTSIIQKLHSEISQRSAFATIDAIQSFLHTNHTKRHYSIHCRFNNLHNRINPYFFSHPGWLASSIIRILTRLPKWIALEVQMQKGDSCPRSSKKLQWPTRGSSSKCVHIMFCLETILTAK